MYNEAVWVRDSPDYYSVTKPLPHVALESFSKQGNVEVGVIRGAVDFRVMCVY